MVELVGSVFESGVKGCPLASCVFVPFVAQSTLLAIFLSSAEGDAGGTPAAKNLLLIVRFAKGCIALSNAEGLTVALLI